jgi:uncharacterized membrane protein
MIISELIGRFHPILVHLPIGIFSMLLFIEILRSLKLFNHLEGSTKFILLSGIITALFSLLTGYILSLEGSNNQNQVDNHMWMAIATTICYVLYYMGKSQIDSKPVLKWPALVILFTSLVITGHQGGVLTHGEGFLVVNQGSDENKSWPAPIISEIEKANVYADMVQYTLNTKCVSCHGIEKQKGKLRLDDIKWIETGGKSGLTINRNDPASSELLKRILLEEIHEEHMPPKGKVQLTAFEKTILQWWITSGASFDKTVSEIGPDSAITKSLNAFKASLKSTPIRLKEREEVEPIKSSVLTELTTAGWGISFIAGNSNYIRVTSYNLEMPASQALEILKKASNNIIDLKLSKKEIRDIDLAVIASFRNLETLWLDNNAITDDGFRKLTDLNHLEYLNASSTELSPTALQELTTIKTLQKVVAVNTKVNEADKKKFQMSTPDLKLILPDSMQRFASDSIFSLKAN